MSAAHLRREQAPISSAAWAEVDAEARRALTAFLAGRRLVDVRGPLGWDHDAEPIGRVERVDGPVDGVLAARRLVQPLSELRTPFTLRREELDAVDRGACDADLEPVVEAAQLAARAEDRLIFHGHHDLGVTGVVGRSSHPPIEVGDDHRDYPASVAVAVERLREAGVDGPYAIALGPDCYTSVVERTEGGHPVLEHLELILGGPVVWAPAVDGAVVLSQRGGDVELVLGQDLAIGYLDHDDREVYLYLEESLAVRRCTPEAAVHLAHPA